MIDYTSVREDLETYLSNNFTECDIVFQNMQPVLEMSEFIVVSDTTVDSSFTSMGSTDQLVTGLVSILIYTPLNTGSGRSRSIASSLATLLSGLQYQSLTFAEPELHSVAIDDKSVYFQQNLQVPYTFAYGDHQISDC